MLPLHIISSDEEVYHVHPVCTSDFSFKKTQNNWQIVCGKVVGLVSFRLYISLSSSFAL